MILLLVLAVILIIIFFPNFSRHQKLLSECERLKVRIEELEGANQRLEEEKYKLEHDMEYIERRAREKLGIVKKDEIPYKIKEEELGGIDED